MKIQRRLIESKNTRPGRFSGSQVLSRNEIFEDGASIEFDGHVFHGFDGLVSQDSAKLQWSCCAWDENDKECNVYFREVFSHHDEWLLVDYDYDDLTEIPYNVKRK